VGSKNWLFIPRPLAAGLLIPNGYSGGKSQMRRYQQSLGSEGWNPESIWRTPPLIGGLVSVLGRQIIYFNDFSGLIYYTDQVQYYQTIVETGFLSTRERNAPMKRISEGEAGLAVGLNARVGLTIGATVTAYAIAELTYQVVQQLAITRGLAF
jgi:hypothetical protein